MTRPKKVKELNPFYVAMGRRLAQARNAAGFTQVEIQSKLGYNSTFTISSHETGERAPRPEEIFKLSQIYGVTMDWLFGRSDHPCLNCNQKMSDLTEKEKELIDNYRVASEKAKFIAEYSLKNESELLGEGGKM